MTDEIMKGISRKLKLTFGEDFEVYFSKDVRQGLKEPAFFIAWLASTQRRMIDARWELRNSFDVHYFPREDGSNTEMVQIGRRLFEELEFVELLNGDLVHGSEMRQETVDGVLHFFVDYNMFLMRPSDETPMETMDLTQLTTE